MENTKLVVENFRTKSAMSAIETEQNIRKFGRILSRARAELQVSRAYMAQILGVREPAIIQWEEGKAFPERRRLADIAKIYEIDLAELITAYEISTNVHKKSTEVVKTIRGMGGSY